MNTEVNARIRATAAWLTLAMVFVSASLAFAVEPTIPSSIDVYWKSTRAIAVPGVTSVIVLDEEIANVQLGNETIEFAGLERGETVALAYVNGNPISIVVHVIARPEKPINPSLLNREAELAHGVYTSDFQTSNAGGTSTFVALSGFAWTQQVGQNRLDVNSQIEDDSQFGGHTANLRTGSIAYHTPNLGISILDFNQSLTGALPQDHINNFSSPGIMQLRGAGVTLDHGKNEYSFFAGSTIPYYFLSLNATRDVAGFAFHRAQTDKLSLFGSTSYVNIPTNLVNGIQRRSYAMQNAGFSYRVGRNFLLGAQGGMSNRGGLFRADASYSSYRLSGYGSVILASQTFPLNQLQSLFSGTSSFKGGLTYKTTFRLTQGFFFEHTDVSPGLIYPVRGSYDYFSPNASFLLARGESLNFNYTYSRNTGGFTQTTTTGNRYDVSFNSQLTQRMSNNAQVTIGSLQDPLGINSQDQFSVRDNISIPIGSQTLLLGVEHDQVQPSLIARLNQELNLLSPALQAEFLANPAAFIDSTNFPPEVKALLAAEQPTGTTVSASGNLAIGSRFRISPNFSLTHSANGSQSETWSQAFGYSLNFQIRPTLQFHSSLNNVFLWDTHRDAIVRSMVLSAGFQKSFTAVPSGLPLMHRSRTIEGHVFRDININGAFNVGEPGIEGVQVQLEDGQTVLTDAQGRYKFPSVSPDQHQVSIALTQFRNPVRMTTRSEIEADLIQQRIAIVNFGILDFARVMGNIYNDVRLQSRREPDSKGMQGIEVLLDSGREIRKAETLGSGDFEIDNVPPGDYKLSIDPASVPANYVAPMEAIPVHVSPVSSVVQDVGMRALRSISGRVLLKQRKETPFDTKSSRGYQAAGGVKKMDSLAGEPSAQAQDYALVPVAGVQISAGTVSAVTDGNGEFLLRNLPAGDLKVTVQPVRAVPPGMQIPNGAVKLPPEPVQIQGATIIIANPELLPYLTTALPAPPGIPEQVLSPKILSASSSSKWMAIPTASPAAPAMPKPIAHPAANNTNHQAAPAPQITRALCDSMTSLGERARCYRQLKQSASGAARQ